METNAAEHLTDPEDQAELLADAFATGDPRYVAHALGIVARAHGMTKLEQATGMKRQALYRALSMDGNPKLDTLMKVMKALHLSLRAEPREAA
ncbi:addiction module antidote protein [Sphingomonas fennica]|uniref:Putative addiction module antidote protein n=1 Tax=Edaphosphingomonas fennica TaxID=114404 RepID=A0A2T4HVR4_9SPHN|nr:addiction module antidote protein [Sphingomonas fennica]PTD19882.1 putative addiction module antidote protein [Sphingomonas fennica]